MTTKSGAVERGKEADRPYQPLTIDGQIEKVRFYHNTGEPSQPTHTAGMTHTIISPIPILPANHHQATQ